MGWALVLEVDGDSFNVVAAFYLTSSHMCSLVSARKTINNKKNNKLHGSYSWRLGLAVLAPVALVSQRGGGKQ